MVKRKGAKTSTLQLTEVELELMTILWQRREGGTVRDVMAGLAPDRALAYTSVSTVLRILEQKGALTTRKIGTSHIYVPAIEKDAYQAETLRKVVTTVFAGDAQNLVARLIDGAVMSKDELERLRQLIDDRLSP